MRIPVGSRHDVSFSGEVTKVVRCSKCGAKFSYQLKRTGTGSGFAFLFIGQGWAEERAAKNAEKNLEKTLARGVDPVPCPSCGHYQLKMVWAVKLFWLLVTSVIALLLLTFCWWLPANAPARSRVWDVFEPGIVAAWCVLGFGLAILLAYSPNYVPVRLFRKRVGKLIEAGRWNDDDPDARLSALASATTPPVPPARGRAGSPEVTPRLSLDPPSLSDVSAALEPGVDAEVLDDAPSPTSSSSGKTDDAGPSDVELAKVGKMNVECSNCHARFHAPIALEGRLIECARCRKPFKIRRIATIL
jgi:DNA-directed RNA polymerase subunit RPC12/RpoP